MRCAKFFVTGCDNAAPPLICEVFVTCHKKQFSAGKCFRCIAGTEQNPQKTRMKHCVKVRFQWLYFALKSTLKLALRFRPETSIPNAESVRQPKQGNDQKREWVKIRKITQKSEINQGFRKHKGLYKSDHRLPRQYPHLHSIGYPVSQKRPVTMSLSCRQPVTVPNWENSVKNKNQGIHGSTVLIVQARRIQIQKCRNDQVSRKASELGSTKQQSK